MIPKGKIKHSEDLKSNNLKSRLHLDFLKVGFQMVRFSNGQALDVAIVSTIRKQYHLKSRQFLSRFQMVFDKMEAICPDFKWSGFQISDPIQNLDHLQPNLFLTIQSPD